MATLITNPVSQYFDKAGRPLNGGLFIGQVNQDPEQFPITVYWDGAGLIPAVQPIPVTAGYPSRNGSPALIYTNEAFSLRTFGPNGEQVYYAAVADGQGASIIKFIPAGAGAVPTTVQAQLRSIQAWSLNLADAPYYFNGDGVTDNYTKLVQALTDNPGKTFYLPDPAVSYVIGTGTITLPANTVIRGQTRKSTKIDHKFNGDAFILGNGAGVENLYVEGNGATYTGRCFVYNGTAGSQFVRGVKAINFSDNIQEFAVAAGSQSVTDDCTLYQYNAATGSGKYATVISATQQLQAVPRHFHAIESGGSPSFNFGGCNDTFVTNSFLGDLNYTDDSRGVQINASRVANQVALAFKGHNNTITGSDINPQITIGANTDNCAIQGNSYNTPPIIDNSANNRNLIDYWQQSYTPTLTSGGVAPAIGNGVITAEASRNGTTTTVVLIFTVGSTTTLGTGGLRFSLPTFQPNTNGRVQIGGSAQISIGAATYTAIAQIPAGTNYVTFLRDTSGAVTFNSPAAFGTGDTIRCVFCYEP